MRGTKDTQSTDRRQVMIQTQFKLTEEQEAILRTYASREQRSTSGAIKFIVCRFLDGYLRDMQTPQSRSTAINYAETLTPVGANADGIE